MFVPGEKELECLNHEWTYYYCGKDEGPHNTLDCDKCNMQHLISIVGLNASGVCENCIQKVRFVQNHTNYGFLCDSYNIGGNINEGEYLGIWMSDDGICENYVYQVELYRMGLW